MRCTFASSPRPTSGWNCTTGLVSTAREIQTDLIDCGQAAGVHPVDLLVAATALGDGFTVLTDDGDYAHQISAVRPELGVRMVGDGPG